MSAPRSTPRRITGRMVLIGMVAFFAVVITVNGIFLYLALDSFPGIETENSYRKGLAHDETLAADRAQRALGWRLDLSWQASGAARGRIELGLAGADGRPLTGRDVRLSLRRPVHAGDDRVARLAESVPGRYGADVTLPAPGNWDAIVTIARPGAPDYRHIQRIIVP